MGIVEIETARELAKELADAISWWIDGHTDPSTETLELWRGHAGAIELLLSDES